MTFDQALQIANVVACMVLLQYLAVIAVLMPGWRHMWVQRLVVVAMTLGLGSQITASFAFLTHRWDIIADIPVPTWPSVLLLVTIASSLLAWNKHAQAFIRCKFTIPSDAKGPMRRVTDWTAVH